jgi:outer membrane receptor protein involved in Fe transport
MRAAAAQTASAVAQASAQQNTGTVNGVVTDTTGVPIPNATVSVKGPTTTSVMTTSAGLFSLPLTPGTYSFAVTKAGFEPATQTDYVVLPGATSNVTVSLAPATLSSLREVGRVSVSSGSSSFNASPASVATISNQQAQDQGQLQVQRLLDQTPGIVIDHPGTSANNAAPGAITFPSIRGGLGFETASLIDGHPLAVQTFGDYVTTFLNTYVLQDIEVIKGPGAAAPETYYAINGTVNFRTLEPTAKLTGAIDQGFDSYGGEFSNFRISDTVLKNKLAFVFDYAIDGTPGPLVNSNGYVQLGSSWLLNGATQVGFTTNANPIKSNINNPFAAQSTALACCIPVNTNYNSKTELAKLRYNFSPATVATVSYLGSQAYTDQNGNHVYSYPTAFGPGSSYPGANNPLILQPGTQTIYSNVFFPANEYEINNEPIFQGEVRTTLGHDTILGRYYTASINRLQYNTLPGEDASLTEPLKLFGTVETCPAGFPTYTSSTKLCSNSGGTTAAPVFNTFAGQNVAVSMPGSYFRETEEDKLHGGSLEYDHFLGDSGNLITLSYNQTNANTDSYEFEPDQFFTIWGGSSVRYSTLLLRGILNPTSKLNVTPALYYDNYSQRYTTNGAASFQTATYGRFDPRLGLTYRADPDVSLRASAGAALAPPYLALLDAGPPGYKLDSSGAFATDTQNQGNVKAETSFGYDVGADVRLPGDGATIFSGDLYLNNVFNQFVSGAVFQNGNITLCKATSKPPPCKSGDTAVTVPLLTSSAQNLNNARYEGIELSLHRDPHVGIGFTTQGALMRAYPYNLSPCIYSTKLTKTGALNCDLYQTNLGIVNGANFYGSGSSGSNGNPSNGAGSNFNSVNNHAIPYAQGYGEIHYRTERGGYIGFGETYYGNNNSLNVPAFWVANASVEFPLPSGFALAITGDNIFNANQNSTILLSQGIGVPLVNGQNGLTNANNIGPAVYRFIFKYRFNGD